MHHLQARARISTEETVDDRGNRSSNLDLGKADTQISAVGVGQKFDLLEPLPHLVEDSDAAIEQRPAVASQFDALRVAVEQPHAERVLQVGNGKDDINAKGGLLGRPVELVYYDDQSNPSLVPAIYTKLIEVAKVDLVVGPYGTNMIVPAILTVQQHNYLTIGLFGVAANREMHYGRYFSMLPAGPDPMLSFSDGFFAVAMQIEPKPRTVAISGADAEFSKVSTAGARINAERVGLKVVYDKSYPPSTADFGPVVRAIQSADADIVYNASYPLDTIGFIRAAHEAGLKAKMFGGNMIGLLAAVFKKQLGPLLNGVVSTADTFVPAPSFDFPGVKEVLQKYGERAAGEHADPLGYQYVPYGYAAMQLLAQAVEATHSLDQNKLSDYMHSRSFKTVVGDVAFGPEGEWTKPRLLMSQYQNVVGNDLEQFRDFRKQVILWPPELKSGNLSYPYEASAR
jgi:branched-chain amino acid transport system substrate-binding protein